MKEFRVLNGKGRFLEGEPVIRLENGVYKSYIGKNFKGRSSSFKMAKRTITKYKTGKARLVWSGENDCTVGALERNAEIIKEARESQK